MDLLYGNRPHEVMIAASIAAGVLLLVWGVRAFAKRRLKKARTTESDFDDFLLDITQRTKIFLLILPVLFLGMRALSFPPELRFVKVGATLSLIAQTALWISGVVDFRVRRYRRTRIESDPSAVMTVNVFRGAAIAAIWIFAVVVAIDNLGFNITGLITGLGIGGVAVALATQNILGDLFASLSIVVDKPFIIGDGIQVDSYGGTVEHIGLKTTRLRAHGGEELIISNGDLLKSRIRNFKRMSERRALTKLLVAHDTHADTLARIPLLLRASVEKQEHARFDRAHFTAIGESGYEFELSYFVAAPEAFLDVQQGVNLDVLRAFESERIELANRRTSLAP
jgi:small-conductance mechanosensitive channel